LPYISVVLSRPWILCLLVKNYYIYMVCLTVRFERNISDISSKVSPKRNELRNQFKASLYSFSDFDVSHSILHTLVKLGNRHSSSSLGKSRGLQYSLCNFCFSAFNVLVFIGRHPLMPKPTTRDHMDNERNFAEVIQSVLKTQSTYQYCSRQAMHENEEQNQMVLYLALSAYHHNCPTQKQ